MTDSSGEQGSKELLQLSCDQVETIVAISQAGWGEMQASWQTVEMRPESTEDLNALFVDCTDVYTNKPGAEQLEQLKGIVD